jgi:hypothetical protein
MVADFVSADFRWLHSLASDGEQSARQVIKPGKNRDGYFSNQDIQAQVKEAMSILMDNAATHLKRAEDALSARHMPKNPSKPGHNWGIEVSKHDPESGKIIIKLTANQRRSKFECVTRNLRMKDHSCSIFQKDTQGLVSFKNSGGAWLWRYVRCSCRMQRFQVRTWG